MLSTMKHWIEPPVFQGDEEKTGRAGLLNLVILISLFITSLTFFALFLRTVIPITTLIIVFLWLLVLLAGRTWLHNGRLGSVELILGTVFFVAITAANISQGSVRSTTTSFYIFWVALVAMLHGLRGLLIGTTLSSLAVMCLILAEHGGLLPKANLNVGVSQWVIFTALFALNAGLAYYTNQLTRRALVRAENEIEHRRQLERELERLARFDSLTKLPNRVLLAERLQQALGQTRRRGQHLAVVFIDLDGFKAVNDNHGHDAGDHLLVTLAERMTDALRDGDILARLGGDEFVAVLLDLSDVEATAPLLNRLLAAVAQPVQFGQAQLQVSASLGITFYPQAQDPAQELEPDQLLRQADQAMYQAKLSGKNRFHVFDPEQDRSVRSHHENMESIRRALAGQELVLEYQPKVNLRTEVVIGVEALIRWVHPEKGLLPPEDFLPMIENHPLAIELGQWVIENALLQIERWQQDGLNIAVSVNIGRRHLRQANFVQGLREALAAHPGVKPGYLEIELLEASTTDDLAHVAQVIQECRKIGVESTLDDFGSGHSSLTCLKKLPVKYVKINQNFVRDMLDSSDNLLILIGVLKLNSAFQFEVIAEGVQTAEHSFMLLQLGCDLAQGYGIAHPMAGADLPDWVRSWKPDPAWSDVQRVSH